MKQKILTKYLSSKGYHQNLRFSQNTEKQNYFLHEPVGYCWWRKWRHVWKSGRLLSLKGTNAYLLWSSNPNSEDFFLQINCTPAKPHSFKDHANDKSCSTWFNQGSRPSNIPEIPHSSRTWSPIVGMWDLIL